MYLYNFDDADALLITIISQHVEDNTMQWLKEKSLFANKDQTFPQFKVAFSMVSRKVQKDILRIDKNQEEEIQKLIAGFHVNGWTIQRLCRVWLMMQIDPINRAGYIEKVEDLFCNAEMNELADLYASLPTLAYPEEWRLRCAEGIRSNIGSVLEAIMLDNPYPALYLDEKAWNQLILKAFFTDKDIHRIIGVAQRANPSLAVALRDYADERQSAHRSVNDQIWELIKLNEHPKEEQSKK